MPGVAVRAVIGHCVLMAEEPMEIQSLSPAASADDVLVERVTDLVNTAFAEAEAGMWGGGAARTGRERMAGLILAGQLVLATRCGRAVGCVRVQRLDAATGELDMLASDAGRRRSGIGRELVHYAEQRCAGEGCTTMRLGLLVPRDWTHPAKQCLAGWYDRMGYRVVHNGPVQDSHPELVARLATPCDFLIYHKQLHRPDPAR